MPTVEIRWPRRGCWGGVFRYGAKGAQGWWAYVTAFSGQSQDRDVNRNGQELLLWLHVFRIIPGTLPFNLLTYLDWLEINLGFSVS